jgi:hypothetical protein
MGSDSAEMLRAVRGDPLNGCRMMIKTTVYTICF